MTDFIQGDIVGFDWQGKPAQGRIIEIREIRDGTGMFADITSSVLPGVTRFHFSKLHLISRIGVKAVNYIAVAQPDLVNAPPHYNTGKVECIDAIEATMTPKEFQKHCSATAIKYLWRWEHKGGKQDLEKSIWYINRAITSLSQNCNNLAQNQ